MDSARLSTRLTIGMSVSTPCVSWAIVSAFDIVSVSKAVAFVGLDWQGRDLRACVCSYYYISSVLLGTDMHFFFIFNVGVLFLFFCVFFFSRCVFECG